MRQGFVLGLGMLVLAGCSHGVAGPQPIPVEGDSIRYATGPCHGACPVYEIRVTPDGKGVFTGKQYTAVTGERRFQLSRAEYDAFAAKLAPYRPGSGTVRYTPGEKNCRFAATDMPSVDITWTRAIGDSQGLYFYYGCHDEANRSIADALGNAPEALPQLEALIGPRP